MRSFLFSFVIISTFCILQLNGHGRMLDPPQRGSMWRFGFDVPPNYNDMSNYCGGIIHQWQKNKGKCGVCGDAYDDDPREHEPGGKYATGIIGKSYKEGEVIEVSIDITANHLGWFEFRLCQNNEPMKKVKKACFDKNLLKVMNNNYEAQQKFIKARKNLDIDIKDYRFFVPHKNNSIFLVKLKLPDGIICSACVLQWRYHAGNNYGKSYGGDNCLGCAEQQEEFYNCADIEITQNLKKTKVYVIEKNTTNETLQSHAQFNSNSYSIFVYLVIMFFIMAFNYY